MPDLAQLVQTGLPMQISPVGQGTMQNMQAGAQIAGIASQNAQRAQEMQQQQIAMQRQQKLQGVYAQSVGPDGQVDPDQVVKNLYGGGFGAEAQALMKEKAQNDYFQAHANYMNGIEQTRAKTEQLAETQKMATLVSNTIGQYRKDNPDLFANPGNYTVPDTVNNPPKTLQEYNTLADQLQNGKALSQAQLAGYDAVYENTPDNLKAKILNPDQFRLDPETGISKLNVLMGEGIDYHKATIDANNTILDNAKSGELAARSAQENAKAGLLNRTPGVKPVAVGGGSPINPKQQAFDEKLGITLGQKINALQGSSRSALGVAGINNQKADRCIEILSDPKIDPTEKDQAVTDLLSVMKGGSPDEVQIKQGMYKSMYENAVNFMQNITGTPQNYNNPDVINKMLNIAKGLKAVDNNTIKNNLGVWAAAAEPWIKRNPQQWSDMTGAVAQSGAGQLPSPASRADVMKLLPGAHFIWQRVEHIKK